MQELENFTRTGMVLGNHIFAWGLALLIFSAVFVLAPWVRKKIVSILAQKAEDRGERFLIIKRTVQALFSNTRGFFIFALALYLSFQVLALPLALHRLVSALFLLASMIQLGLWASTLVGSWIENSLLDKRHYDPEKRSAAQLIRIIALTVVWSAIFLVTLSNFGIDITALIAGLGIGGIAIAFAL